MPIVDNFRSKNDYTGAIRHAETPTADTDLTYVTRALWVADAGDVSVDMESGSTVIFKGVAAGTLLPLRIKQVNTTGTTATIADMRACS